MFPRAAFAAPVLSPVKAVLGFLFSLGASMGTVTSVFRQGHLSGLFGVQADGPILSFLPVLVIGIPFGPAMDDEVFLLHLLGRGAWWLPQRLQRLLPDVGIEGAALVRPAGRHVSPEPVPPGRAGRAPRSCA